MAASPESSTNPPSTYFAPATRATPEEVRRAIEAVSESPVFQKITESFGSIVAVLNQHRQILTVNDGLLRFLGIQDASRILGLRPGEAFQCIHSLDHREGCGTSRFCRTCGAAIAIVLALTTHEPAERECLLTLGGKDNLAAFELLVRATPFDLDGESLILLLIHDIRGDKRRQALERVFFHDVMNSLQGLMGCIETLQTTAPRKQDSLVHSLVSITHHIVDEVRNQALISQVDAGEYALLRRRTSASRAISEVETTFKNHPARRQRELIALQPLPDIELETDPELLHRTLVNMAKNALEATPPHGEARLWCEKNEEDCCFYVWNAGQIPESIGMRLFQRYYSTKGESGRGLGTYAMKLFGERYLGGHVGFTTSPEEGTVFFLRLPVAG